MITFSSDLLRAEWNEVSIVLEISSLGRRNPDEIMVAFRNSRRTVFAYDGDRLIGTGRLFGDSIYSSVICDLSLLPEYRGGNIGRFMVEVLVKNVHTPQILFIDTESGSELCRECGFNVIMPVMGMNSQNHLEQHSVKTAYKA